MPQRLAPTQPVFTRMRGMKHSFTYAPFTTPVASAPRLAVLLISWCACICAQGTRESLAHDFSDQRDYLEVLLVLILATVWRWYLAEFFAQHREKEAQMICADLMALAKVCLTVCTCVRLFDRGGVMSPVSTPPPPPALCAP